MVGAFGGREDPDEAVYVVGHDDESIQVYFGAERSGACPFLGHNATTGVQDHSPTGNMSEEVGLLVCADRHEVSTGLSVIVPAKPHGATVVFFGVVGHGIACFYPLCYR